MKWSRTLLTLLTLQILSSVLTLVGLTPLEASARLAPGEHTVRQVWLALSSSCDSRATELFGSASWQLRATLRRSVMR